MGKKYYIAELFAYAFWGYLIIFEFHLPILLNACCESISSTLLFIARLVVYFNLATTTQLQLNRPKIFWNDAVC